MIALHSIMLPMFPVYRMCIGVNDGNSPCNKYIISDIDGFSTAKM